MTRRAASHLIASHPIRRDFWTAVNALERFLNMHPHPFQRERKSLWVYLAQGYSLDVVLGSIEIKGSGVEHLVEIAHADRELAFFDLMQRCADELEGFLEAEGLMDPTQGNPEDESQSNPVKELSEAERQLGKLYLDEEGRPKMPTLGKPHFDFCRYYYELDKLGIAHGKHSQIAKEVGLSYARWRSVYADWLKETNQTPPRNKRNKPKRRNSQTRYKKSQVQYKK